MRLTTANIINGLYSDTALSWAAMRAVNWLPEAAEVEGTRTPRKYATPPGLRLLVDLQTGAPVRGLEDVEGRLFAVSGTNLFEITNDLTAVNRGEIPGVGRVSMAHNQQGGATDANELAIANGLSGYVYNTDTTVLTQITDDAFEGASTFDYVDGFMTYTDPQGRWWAHSDLNQALQYSSIDRNDAESAPDKIVSHIVSHREVIVWGTRTGEFFRNTGAATGTFQRVDGTEMEVGICSAFARTRVDNTVCWVGNDLTVYRLNGHAPQRISTRPIEQLLAVVDPATIFCFTWEDRGHKVFYVTSPNNFTVGYDFAAGLWHARESYGLEQWRINALVRWGSRWVAGDYVNGLIYELKWDWYTENGQPLVSRCATGYTTAEQNRVLCPYAELIFDTGGKSGVGYGFEVPEIAGDVQDGAIGDDIETSYTVTGGVPPYSLSVVSGSLPPGITLNALSGAVTGAYTTAGNYSWEVEVVDDDGNTAQVSDSAVVAPIGFAAVNATLAYMGNSTAWSQASANGAGGEYVRFAGNRVMVFRSSSLLVSDDWLATTTPRTAPWAGITDAPVVTSSGRVYVTDGAAQSIYYSDDGGDSWTTVNLSFSCTFIAGDDDQLVVGSTTQFRVALAGPNSFGSAQASPMSSHTCIDYGDGMFIFGGPPFSTISKWSKDKCQTFTSVTLPSPGGDPLETFSYFRESGGAWMAFNRLNAASANETVARSPDGMSAFVYVTVPGGYPGSGSVDGFAERAGVVYGVVNIDGGPVFGFLRSTDGGSTWTLVPQTMPGGTVLSRPLSISALG